MPDPTAGSFVSACWWPGADPAAVGAPWRWGRRSVVPALAPEGLAGRLGCRAGCRSPGEEHSVISGATRACLIEVDYSND